MLQKNFRNVEVTLLARHEQRCTTILIGLIHGFSVLQKNSRNVEVTALTRYI